MRILPDSHQLASTIDRSSVRVALAVVVGLPAAWFGIVFGYLGLAFGLSSLMRNFDLLPAALVVVTTFGLLGILGGWIRLLRRRTRMSDPVRRLTVSFLWCGVIAAVCLGASELLLGEPKPSALLRATGWAVMAVIGMVLIHATPAGKMNAKAQPLTNAWDDSDTQPAAPEGACVGKPASRL